MCSWNLDTQLFLTFHQVPSGRPLARSIGLAHSQKEYYLINISLLKKGLNTYTCVCCVQLPATSYTARSQTVDQIFRLKLKFRRKANSSRNVISPLLRGIASRPKIVKMLLKSCALELADWQVLIQESYVVVTQNIEWGSIIKKEVYFCRAVVHFISKQSKSSRQNGHFQKWIYQCLLLLIWKKLVRLSQYTHAQGLITVHACAGIDPRSDLILWTSRIRGVF